MTAKEKLRQTVEELSEEPTTPEEDEGAREASAQIARGEVISADEIRREVA